MAVFGEFTFCNNIPYGSSAMHYMPNTGSGEATVVANGKHIPYIQNLDSDLCTTTPQLTKDNRDDQLYTVQKLKDGRCWMMTNLNLGTTNIATDLTPVNTDINSTITASAFNGWRKTTSGAQQSAFYIPITTLNSSDGLDTDPVSKTKYGTLYNYCAVTAGTICSDGKYDATYSLCPAGWKLPSLGELETLYVYYDSYEKMRASISDGGAAFALAGQTNHNSVVDQGDKGLYWTSTKSNDNVNPNQDSMILIMYESDKSIMFPYRFRLFANSARCIRTN